MSAFRFNEAVAYVVPYARYGNAKDPMPGNNVGGINLFGEGLGLYAAGKRMIDGIGVAATRRAPITIAWCLRANLGLDHLMGASGVSGDNPSS